MPKIKYDGWELDALEPKVLSTLIADAIKAVMGPDKFTAAKVRQAAERKQIEETSNRWDDVVSYLGLEDLEPAEEEDDDGDDDEN